MLEDRFDDRLRDAAGDYNDPPETPREAMWERIVAERAQRTAEGAEGKEAEEEAAVGKEAEGAETRDIRVLPFRRFRSYRFLRPLAVAAGIAAVLALGIGLGRLTVDRSQPIKVAPLAVQPTPRVSAAAYQLVTTEHLSQAETFLTLFRASVRQGGSEQLASATARQLLASNRLLLDSPAANDGRTRALLQDLELVLAEIAQLSPQPRSRDLDLIKEGLEQGGVLSRLRIAVPSGGSATQGAL